MARGRIYIDAYVTAPSQISVKDIVVVLGEVNPRCGIVDVGRYRPRACDNA